MNERLPKIIVICGPTGSGKTSLAVSLCKKFDGEIVNADSRQVYREMDIGTSKEVQTQNSKLKTKKLGVALPQYYINNIPIHLINVIDPDTRYTVGQFKKDAEKVIADIISRGKIPFLVGGTGLYVDSIVENFSFPPISNLKTKISKPNLKTKNLEKLVKELLKLDPDAQYEVDLKNRRRVERAIEVCLATGMPFTKQRKKGERKYNVLKLGIKIERDKLYKKINKRVDQMIEAGLEEEVRQLAKKYGWDSEAMTGIGYREWKNYFTSAGATSLVAQKEGRTNGSPLQDVINQIKQDTRHYAKRQMTWFKRDKEIFWIYPVKLLRSGFAGFDKVNYEEAEKLMENFLIS